MCFNLCEKLQANLYCAQLQKAFLTNGGCFSLCSFLFIIKSSSYSFAFLPSQSYMGNSAQSLSWVHFFFYCRYTVNEIVRIPSFQPSLLSLFLFPWEIIMVGSQDCQDIFESKSLERQEVYFGEVFQGSQTIATWAFYFELLFRQGIMTEGVHLISTEK